MAKRLPHVGTRMYGQTGNTPTWKLLVDMDDFEHQKQVMFVMSFHL